MTTIVYTFFGILLATLVGVIAFMYVDGAGARSTGEARSVASVASLMIERVHLYQEANGVLPEDLDAINLTGTGTDRDMIGMAREGTIAGIPDSRWIYNGNEGEGLSQICLSVPDRYLSSLVKAKPLLQGTRGVSVSDRCGPVPLPDRAVLQLTI